LRRLLIDSPRARAATFRLLSVKFWYILLSKSIGTGILMCLVQPGTVTPERLATNRRGGRPRRRRCQSGVSYPGTVIPAKAGIQVLGNCFRPRFPGLAFPWIPLRTNEGVRGSESLANDRTHAAAMSRMIPVHKQSLISECSDKDTHASPKSREMKEELTMFLITKG
jgi:hypothetical protein